MNNLGRVAVGSFVGVDAHFVDTEHSGHTEKRGIGDVPPPRTPVPRPKDELFLGAHLDIYAPQFCGRGKCVKMICGCGKVLSKMPHNKATRLRGHEWARILGGLCS